MSSIVALLQHRKKMNSFSLKVLQLTLFSLMLSSNNPHADLVMQSKDDEGWKCLDGSFSISDELFCDEKIDCPDGSDEDPAQCGTPCYILCPSSTTCISFDSYCNGIPECEDGSDEFGCESMCLEFTCENDPFHCLPFDSVCDTYSDCMDGSDEVCDQEENTMPSPNSTTSKSHTVTSSMAPTTESSTLKTTLSTTTSQKFVPTQKKLRKCKKNPKRKACANMLQILAADHSTEIVELCVKKHKKLTKKEKKLCRRWRPVLELRRISHPGEFVPDKCKRKPSRRSCIKHRKFLAQGISSKTEKKCRRHPNTKKCRKIKVLLDILANQAKDNES